jgi:ABC-type dipeptide/oligopeptide/nickel transport system permease component
MLGVYALAYYGAGDPIKLIFLRAPGDVAYGPAKTEAIRASAGLDRPFIVQYASYIWNLLHGNFGNSLTSGRSVWVMVSNAAPVSATLGALAIGLTTLIGSFRVMASSLLVDLLYPLLDPRAADFIASR